VRPRIAARPVRPIPWAFARRRPAGPVVNSHGAQARGRQDQPGPVVFLSVSWSPVGATERRSIASGGAPWVAWRAYPSTGLRLVATTMRPCGPDTACRTGVCCHGKPCCKGYAEHRRAISGNTGCQAARGTWPGRARAATSNPWHMARRALAGKPMSDAPANGPHEAGQEHAFPTAGKHGTPYRTTRVASNPWHMARRALAGKPISDAPANGPHEAGQEHAFPTAGKHGTRYRTARAGPCGSALRCDRQPVARGAAPGEARPLIPLPGMGEGGAAG